MVVARALVSARLSVWSYVNVPAKDHGCSYLDFNEIVFDEIVLSILCVLLYQYIRKPSMLNE